MMGRITGWGPYVFRDSWVLSVGRGAVFFYGGNSPPGGLGVGFLGNSLMVFSLVYGVVTTAVSRIV